MNETQVQRIAATPLRVVIVGHVDHGKSTLVGRLFNDTGSLPDGKVEAIAEMCRKRGMPFEWAFVMDAFKAERDQGITVDTAQIRFASEKRDYVLIDAPGHKEFLKNMITGAASADAAVLVVDAKEGVREQTRQHGYLLHLLGIRQVVVAVNKMDLVGYDEDRFHAVAEECRNYLAELGLESARVEIVPVSAREGDNIVGVSASTPWHVGVSIVSALDTFEPPAALADQALRLPVQDVYKFDERRAIVGRIESGTLAVGDELVFSPSNKRARVVSLETWHAAQPSSASAGESVAFTFDPQVFVERGDIASTEGDMPMLTNAFSARLFWLGRNPLTIGRRYKLKLNTAEYAVEVASIARAINVDDLSGAAADQVLRNTVAEVVFRSRGLMAVDPFTVNVRTGRFVLVEDYDIVGGGLISMDGFEDQRDRFAVKSANITRVEHRVPLEERWDTNAHRSGILWLTGLSGSGKSTLAFRLEQHLFRRGMQVYVLDGDNIRHGLSADLGFSPDDREENIRRVGETARLFARAGIIVITAFISPYRADRDHVRAIAPDMFHEIHVRASLDECERRDPKGLYAKARRGEITEFTGVSAPYEAPVSPELVVDTTNRSIDESLDILLNYVSDRFVMKPNRN